MEIVVALVAIAVVIWIVAAARKGTDRSVARVTALSDQTRSELEAHLAAGELPTLQEPHLALHRGEVAHLQLQAELMKDVVDREYRGGHHGMSFRVAKGVRYYTGSSRGKMVTVGSHLEVADRGTLTVTSQRTVFTGLRRTIEVPHKRVVQIVRMLNGLQIHASNRANPPLFRVAQQDAPLLASVVNQAQQRVLALADSC